MRGEVAMPQRNNTINAIKRRAAEKKTAEEKKKAEARARAAYRRKQRKFEENGLLEGLRRSTGRSWRRATS